MFKPLDIQALQPGMVIVRVIAQNGPVKIKKSGLVTSKDMVQGLIEMGILQVEIDTDQTVEVAAPAIKKSATLRMLESKKVVHTHIDDGVSEQYHRSLFLPSAQAIPSALHFYAKRYLLAAFIVLGGVCTGWTLAHYQLILTLLTPAFSEPNTSVHIPVPTVDNLQTALPDVSTNGTSKRVTLPQVIAPQNILSRDVASQYSVPQEILPQGGEQNVEPSNMVQTVLPSLEPAPLISADLLKSFQKAIAETEDLPVTSPPVESLYDNEDVPRIDQLPAWVMNRLPSMAFSVHMYASLESERWVRVNGTRMAQGDRIDNMVEIVRIDPQHVILHYSGQTFSMAALTDW
jgi:general secretion pathway protein B